MVVLGKVRKSGGMGIIRCEKGLHFYDNVKYDKCPYCEQRKQQIQKNTNIMQEQKTVAVQAEKLSELEEYICRQEKEKIEQIEKEEQVLPKREPEKAAPRL